MTNVNTVKKTTVTIEVEDFLNKLDIGIDGNLVAIELVQGVDGFDNDTNIVRFIAESETDEVNV